ncbi:MAG: hypothetical protein QM775_13175 [Pirellulales bacterium]
MITSILSGTSFQISNQAGQTLTGVTLTPSYAMTLASGGLILNSSADQTHNAPIVTSGELIIFRSSAAGIATLSGPITAAGITKFGLGDMRISGDNRGTLTGDVVVSGLNWFRLENQYALGGDVANPYAPTNNLISNGGQFHTAAQLAFLQTTMIVNQDTRMGFNSGILVRGSSMLTRITPLTRRW